MKKFYWIEKDYHNDSLNNLAKRVTEYNTAELIANNYNVFYSESLPDDLSEYADVGKLSIRKENVYTVNDIPIINDIFNYNLYFINNTEHRLIIPEEQKGTFDCLVSLAAGNMIETNIEDIGLVTDNHYVIDISPTAIHKSIGLYKDLSKDFSLVDIFDEIALKSFLSTCEGSKGFFVVSNCFCYVVNSLIYDVRLRLQMQNKFIKILAEDKIDWYVSILTADGISYNCVRAKDITDKNLDDRFNIFPWIKK